MGKLLFEYKQRCRSVEIFDDIVEIALQLLSECRVAWSSTDHHRNECISSSLISIGRIRTIFEHPLQSNERVAGDREDIQMNSSR